MTFEKQGRQNTEAALKLAIEAAREEGIHKIVVASTTGATAKKLAEMEHEGIQIIDVAMPVVYLASMKPRCRTRCARSWRPWA